MTAEPADDARQRLRDLRASSIRPFPISDRGDSWTQ